MHTYVYIFIILKGIKGSYLPIQCCNHSSYIAAITLHLLHVSDLCEAREPWYL